MHEKVLQKPLFLQMLVKKIPVHIPKKANY